MNVFDAVQTARHDVAPMPLAERRRIREELFGTGAHDTARTITGRSESGAVVSTAPHGLRVPARARKRRRTAVAKSAAGVALLAVGGTIAWNTFGGDDSSADETNDTVVATAAPTTAVASTPAPVVTPERTGVTAALPLLLPATQLTATELLIAPASVGFGDALLSAPDGSNVWIGEFDGVGGNLSEFEVTAIGAINVGASEQPTGVSYRIDVPCGVVIVNDGPGTTAFRPAVVSLFEAMSVDGEGVIDISLPTGWSVIDVGMSRTSYISEFEVPVFTELVPVRLTQVPGGSFSQLTFGGRQLQTTEFLGGPAFIDTVAGANGATSIYWRDDNTVFNVSSDQLTVVDLESFVAELEPATTADWTTRFDLETPTPTELDALCDPQPSLGSTLNP